MNSEDISAELLAIRDRFVDSLPERIKQLQDAMSVWSFDNRTPEAKLGFDALYNLTHQLVGTAGSVGFPTLSVIARDLNLKLRHLQDADRDILEENTLAELRADFAELTAVAQSCMNPR